MDIWHYLKTTPVSVTLKMKDNNYNPYYLPLITTCSLGSLRGRVWFFCKSLISCGEGTFEEVIISVYSAHCMKPVSGYMEVHLSMF